VKTGLGSGSTDPTLFKGLHILLLTSGFPPVVGGAETYAATLATGLAGLGHDVIVATDDTGDWAPAAVDQTGPLVWRLAQYRRLLADPSKLRWEQMAFGILPELRERLGGWHPDLVVANGLETTVLGRIAADEFGVALVGSYHEHAPEDEPFGMGKMALGYRYLAPDAVLAGSLGYYARARRFLGEERVHLIHHGVDTERFSPDRDGARMRARYGIGPGRALVVTAGRLKPRKGQMDLIHAFAVAAEPTAHLVIAGSVSSASLDYADELNARIGDLDLHGRVTIDQHVLPADMPELLAAADIVAQPSHSEGLGLALLEAMSGARPCVATRIAGHAEIFSAAEQARDVTPDDLVELVEPRDVNALAGALKRLQADDARRAALGIAARDHVTRHFSQGMMIKRTDALLRDLATLGRRDDR
jgi:glycosyltransferase involved in cell wall biosynthesis